jgi:iron(III) transport system substrate-binding protein
MSPFKALIAVAFIIILGVPFLARPRAEKSANAAADRTLVIITPHVQQIRDEFARAFADWSLRTHGQRVRIVWNIPGGTSEIVKTLQAQYTAAIKNGDIAPDGSCKPGVIPIDLMLGGGSYDHGRLKRGVSVKVNTGSGEQDVNLSMSVPAGIDPATLKDWFGENKIGAQNLYEPEQYWIGTALSSFGIVYNRDLCRARNIPDPSGFEDLTRPEMFGLVALADPRQSGSIATTFDAILSAYGWEKGWRVLREMTGNTRYFTNSSTKPPIDVGQGEAIAGLAIDFYGRNQAEQISLPGQDPATARVGYVDPKGAVYIDADPVSVLRGGPEPELARQFIAFCLSDEGQALWNLPSSRDPRGVSNPTIASGGKTIRLGPEVSNLRRLPICRSFYAKYGKFMTDQVDPYAIASQNTPKGWRDAIAPMMAAFSVDVMREQHEAWKALLAARADSAFSSSARSEMEAAFFAWPKTKMPDGSVLEFDERNIKAILAAWKDATKKNPGQVVRWQIEYTSFFRDQYRKVVEISKGQHEPPLN